MIKFKKVTHYSVFIPNKMGMLNNICHYDYDCGGVKVGSLKCAHCKSFMRRIHIPVLGDYVVCRNDKEWQ